MVSVAREMDLEACGSAGERPSLRWLPLETELLSGEYQPDRGGKRAIASP